MDNDSAALSEKCENCIKMNPKPLKDAPVILEVTIEDMHLMDHLGLDIFKHGGKNYLVMANAARGFCWCELLGKKTTSKEVPDIVRRLFLKLCILYTVQMDG